MPATRFARDWPLTRPTSSASRFRFPVMDSVLGTPLTCSFGMGSGALDFRGISIAFSRIMGFSFVEGSGLGFVSEGSISREISLKK